MLQTGVSAVENIFIRRTRTMGNWRKGIGNGTERKTGPQRNTTTWESLWKRGADWNGNPFLIFFS
jgi:hypothetical protein